MSSSCADESTPKARSTHAKRDAKRTCAKVLTYLSTIPCTADANCIPGDELTALLKRKGIEYERMIYLGDGSNDFCPILRLREYVSCMRSSVPRLKPHQARCRFRPRGSQPAAPHHKRGQRSRFGLRCQVLGWRVGSRGVVCKHLENAGIPPPKIFNIDSCAFRPSVFQITTKQETRRGAVTTETTKNAIKGSCNLKGRLRAFRNLSFRSSVSLVSTGMASTCSGSTGHTDVWRTCDAGTTVRGSGVEHEPDVLL